ncbi:MAG: hypothetical protein LBL34_06665 [Clostridiales bacterium]|jgi:hypothetical protein|nr:hypothetical protein [Clostridiales bacterium]
MNIFSKLKLSTINWLTTSITRVNANSGSANERYPRQSIGDTTMEEKPVEHMLLTPNELLLFNELSAEIGYDAEEFKNQLVGLWKRHSENKTPDIPDEAQFEGYRAFMEQKWLENKDLAAITKVKKLIRRLEPKVNDLPEDKDRESITAANALLSSVSRCMDFRLEFISDRHKDERDALRAKLGAMMEQLNLYIGDERERRVQKGVNSASKDDSLRSAMKEKENGNVDPHMNIETLKNAVDSIYTLSKLENSDDTQSYPRYVSAKLNDADVRLLLSVCKRNGITPPSVLLEIRGIIK